MIDGVMMSPDQSEQQAVDCVSSVNGYGSQGCNGGGRGGGRAGADAQQRAFRARLLLPGSAFSWQLSKGRKEDRSAWVQRLRASCAGVAPLTWRHRPSLLALSQAIPTRS